MAFGSNLISSSACLAILHILSEQLVIMTQSGINYNHIKMYNNVQYHHFDRLVYIGLNWSNHFDRVGLNWSNSNLDRVGLYRSKLV